jgi:transposase
VRLLAQHPYTAKQLLQRLKEGGYEGGYSILKAYVQHVRPPSAPAFLTLHFAPGQSAQVDWGSAGFLPVGHTRRPLSFFVMVLCYSRRMYVEFTLAQTQEHFLACHQHAFEYFTGVTAEVMVDNCKTAVLSHPYDRYQDFEKPEHVEELLAQRRQARQQQTLTRFLALSPRAREYYQRLEEKRGNARHHAQKIVALSEIYGVEKVQRALEDAWAYQAFSCEYIANILEQRERPVTQPGALHLTRQQDLLDLDLPAPDLSLYESEEGGVP